MSNSLLEIQCLCGHVLRASAGECGLNIRCPRCNAPSEVPDLLTFRKNATLYSADELRRIRYLTPKSRRHVQVQFSLKTLCYAIAVVSVLLAVYGFHYRLVRLPEQRRIAAMRLRNTALALLMYSDNNAGRLPPPMTILSNGTVLHSWRSLLDPYLDLGCTWMDYDRPWDDPSLASWRQTAPSYYCLHDRNDPKRRSETVISVVIGPGTPFDPSQKNSYSELDPETILFVEVRDSGAHWMRPWDLSIETMPRMINAGGQPSISGNLPGGFFVAFADTQVWFLSNDTPFDTLAPFLTIKGSKQNDREQSLGPYRIDAW